MKKPNKSSGFSLVELAITLAIIALIMVFFLGAGSVFIEVRKVEATRTKLKAIDIALAGFVAINGRLPCPAGGNLTDGRELGGTGGCTDDQQRGVVPWATLGLSEADVLDSWFNRITYRVGSNLWIAGAMDMTACDTAGTGSGTGSTINLICQSPCSSTNLANCTSPTTFLQQGKGLTLQDGFGVVLMNASASPTEGAAYVLISHGKNGAGAYSQGGTTLISTSGAGSAEVQNANNVAVRISPDYYVDKEINETAGTGYFDDLVLRPSIIRVILQAQRGPRAH